MGTAHMLFLAFAFIPICVHTKRRKEYPTKAEISPRQAHVLAPNLKSSAAALAQQIQYSMYVSLSVFTVSNRS